MTWAVCVKNDGFKASLELRKLYRVIEDETSAQRACIRVIDESGEDYVFPAKMFQPLQIAHKIEAQLEALA
jgi:hypothetical protein